jgi:type I restriction enzyme S subunit
MTLGSNAVALKARGHSAFMYLYFSGAKGQHDIQSIVTGSAQLKFNKTNFRSLLIALPEAAVLQHFESIAGALLSTIDINLATAQTLATLRDTLLPRLISGQLRLPEAQAAAEEALA